MRACVRACVCVCVCVCDDVQGEVTRDSEGRGSQSEGQFGMGINDEEVLCRHGRRGFKVES